MLIQLTVVTSNRVTRVLSVIVNGFFVEAIHGLLTGKIFFVHLEIYDGDQGISSFYDG